MAPLHHHLKLQGVNSLMNRIDKNMIDEKDINNLRNCISYDEV